MSESRRLATMLRDLVDTLIPGDERWPPASLAAFEANEAALFTLVRTATYLGYYENPAVIRQVQALGQPYRAVAIHRGYPQAPFDPARDTPRHGRGSYGPTASVERLDLDPVTGGEHGRP
mgnify:FL=1